MTQEIIPDRQTVQSCLSKKTNRNIWDRYCCILDADSRFPEGEHKNRSNINYSKLISLVHILV